MKLKVIPFLLSLCMIFSLSIIPAFAYYEEIDSTLYMGTNNRMIAKGTIKTNAPSNYVSYIQVNMTVTDDTDAGKVLYENQEIVDGKDQLTVTAIVPLRWRGDYTNEVMGVLKYVNGQRYTPMPARTTKTFSPTKGASVLSDTQAKEMISWHRDSRDPILESFNYNPQDYSYYYGGTLTEGLSSDAYAYIRSQIDLNVGDLVPGYYLNSDQSQVIAVNQTASGENQLYIFTASDDGTWNLV